MSTRLGPAIIHLLQFYTVVLSILGVGLPFVPVVVVLVFPFITAGFFIKDGRGLPKHWHRLPYSLPTTLFVDIPVGTAFFVLSAFSILVFHPAAHVVMELLHVLGLLRGIGQTQTRPLDEEAAGTPASSAPVSIQKQRSSENMQLDGNRYRQPDSLWAALENGDVRLVSLKWLTALAERGGTLARRQELPEEAFIDSARLKKIEAGAKAAFYVEGFFLAVAAAAGKPLFTAVKDVLVALVRRKRNVDHLVPIVAVSYIWLEAAHPDQHGAQLRLMFRKLRELYGRGGLLGACQQYGFSDMGVFIDWASLYQKDPQKWQSWMDGPDRWKSDQDLAVVAVDGPKMVAERHAYNESRSSEETAAFRRALENTMDLWYGHGATTVILLTELPDELPIGFDVTRTYAARGWTTFEQCSAELAKSFKLNRAQWKLVIDVGLDGNEGKGGARRRLPTTPERMEALLETRQFTNGADKGAVLELYRRTASAVLGTIVSLNYQGLALQQDDEWCSPSRLSEALNYCSSLESITLAATRLSDEGMAALMDALDPDALPALKILDCNFNRFGVVGVRTLTGAFRRGVAPKLEFLGLSGCLFGDAGASSFAIALQSGGLPSRLALVDLNLNDIADEGGMALAAALEVSGSKCRIFLANNRIGLAVQSALLCALERTHGLTIMHACAVLALNPPFYPPAAARATGRGMRLYFEAGRIA
jgi:hypothetical protein